MDFLTLLVMFNYGLVLIYGVFLSIDISGGWRGQRQKHLVFLLCPLLLLVQALFYGFLGIAAAEQFYPLIVHLPLVLALVFALKKSIGVALASVCTAYLCCQLPHWVNLILTAVTNASLAGEIGYTLSVIPFFLLLRRYFVPAAHSAITYSPQMLLLFGSLPFAYYLFDYATTVYSDALYIGVQALNEFLSTALIAFYVLFLTAYHAQFQRRAKAELQRSMVEAELKQSAFEIESLRRAEAQTAIYQHNMRHHLAAIDGFLSAENPQQAKEYIRKVQGDVDSIRPKRFCENELVNLICSSFAHKAEQQGIRLSVEARLPRQLTTSDTELCSILSNGLENALYAVAPLDASRKWTELYCGIRANKLLIEIKNPYGGKIAMRDGLPLSERKDHGYGCRSIRSITEQNGGLCTFEPERGVFTLRVVLPTYGDTV